MSSHFDTGQVNPPHARIEVARVAAWLDILETLREKFWEYREGWLSEKDFKKAVATYSETLQEMRKCVPDDVIGADHG